MTTSKYDLNTIEGLREAVNELLREGQRILPPLYGVPNIRNVKEGEWIPFDDGSVQGFYTKLRNVLYFMNINGSGLPANNDVITTLDGNQLRRRLVVAANALQAGDDETAALYIKIDPVGASNQIVGFYGEITDAQEDTEAAYMKIVHYGHGDAIYTALFGNAGVGFEAASFHDGTKGIISTMQQDGCPNSVLYNGYWGEYVVPLYGMAYYDQSPGNAVTVRPTPLAAASQAQIRIWTPDISATTFEATTDGTVKLKRINATESFTPTGTADTAGNVGDITKDDNYIYVKTSAGWKRSALSTW